MLNFKKYCEDTGGNFSIVIAVGALVITAGVGAAVETANMSRLKNQLQSQVDIATLTAASTPADSVSDADYSALAYDVMLKNGYAAGNDQPTAMTSGGFLDVNATVDYEGLFTELLGGKTFKLSASAQATLPSIQKMEIVLALDNTASMGYGGKIGALKVGAGKLMDAIDESDNGTKVGLVPFARYINIGDASGTWLDTPAEYDTERSWQQATHNCESVTYEPTTATRDGETYTYDKEVCNGRTTTYETQTKIIESRFEGCVGTTEEPNHLDTISANDRVIGLLNVVPREVSGKKSDTPANCPIAIFPLDDNYDKIGEEINSMFPVDGTYIPSGLMWAERLLDRTVAFTQSPKEDGIKQAIVLMSDGKNTASIQTDEDVYGEYELSTPPYIWQNISETDPSAVKTDADTLLLCDRIKEKGIEIYTISFQIDDENAKALLVDCATAPAYAYDAGNNTDLIASFEDIGDGLSSNVRLTR